MAFDAPKLLDYKPDKQHFGDAVDTSIDQLESRGIKVDCLHLHSIDKEGDLIKMRIIHTDMYKMWAKHNKSTNNKDKWVIYPPMSYFMGKHFEFTYSIEQNALIN